MRTMKKAKLLTMTVVVFSIMICWAMSAFALTEGNWEFQLLDEEVKITGYTGTEENLVIPTHLYNLPVTSLDFVSCRIQNAKSITIPGSIKKVPIRVFAGSETLETVILGEGVEEIDYSAESGAFENCKNLKKVVLPSSLRSIGYKAFSYCKALTEITFPPAVEKIGVCAFEHSGLVTADLRTLPPQAEIGKHAFSWCENLKSVKLHQGLKEILSSTFWHCSALTDIEIPNTVTYIGESAFASCFSLKEIVLPTSLKSIESKCFVGTAITELIIPYGTESVSFRLFEDSETLMAIYIPDTVNNMYSSPISNCPNCIIYCGKDSHAAEQCKKNEVSYLTDSSVNSGITVLYNGKRISFHAYAQNPEITEGRTLVPLRSIFEAMGAEVEWDDTTKTATAKRGNVTVTIGIGASEMYKNGKAVPVDVPAQIVNSRTMVPVRVIAEAFDADVQWNNNGRTVLITE